MNSRPWYKRYPADFTSGVLGLSLEEKGAYSLILDLIYDRGGPIPDDDKYIAGVCGCSTRRWRSIRSVLSASGKLHFREGLIHNLRAEKELLKAMNAARERVENGRKGGRKSAEIRNISLPGKAVWQVGLKPPPAFQKSEARSQKPESEAREAGLAATAVKRSLMNGWADQDMDHPDQDLRRAPRQGHEVDPGHWRQRLAWARQDGFWPADWGPAPGQSGCCIPADFLEEGDERLLQGRPPSFFAGEIS